MYCPTILIDAELHEQLRTGKKTLRPRQWVQLSHSARKARFIGVTPCGKFCVQHYEGNYARSKFHAVLDDWRGQCAYAAQQSEWS